MGSSMDFERPWERAERNEALDRLALKKLKTDMKEKLRIKRFEGYGDWDKCKPEVLSKMLREHVEKGDPLDVANFCMMLHYKGNRIT